MKVFISWSGERSQALALALRDWVPLVLHYVEPWLSEADVAAGERWAQVVATELEASNFGVICVTPENVSEPWVLFEAGALAKSMQGARVVPLLFNLDFSDISGPLAQFQAKKFEKSGLGEVLMSMNQATEEAVPEDRATQLFNALWPEFEKQLGAIPDEAPTEKHMRPQHEIIEELVTGVRGLDSRFRDLENVITREGPRPDRRLRLMHPGMFEDMMHMVGADNPTDPVGLLMLAGFLRDDFPWIYEVIIDVYREIRSGDAEAASMARHRLRRFMRGFRHGPMMEMFEPRTKEAQILMMELPMMLDHFLHRYEGGPEEEEEETEEPTE